MSCLCLKKSDLILLYYTDYKGSGPVGSVTSTTVTKSVEEPDKPDKPITVTPEKDATNDITITVQDVKKEKSSIARHHLNPNLDQEAEGESWKKRDSMKKSIGKMNQLL